ncbi:hypothetical protein Nepgr_018051 [Nepenthes gracilis]|uniref:Uncharacterized protein n=1 Tax=Nepenthes gracilis TaxID=150966 RepID=A0AAD3SSK5_NEPGR|nr:hypothetical protein Nepgr_018051 [Nepenthes gracilis]
MKKPGAIPKPRPASNTEFGVGRPVKLHGVQKVGIVANVSKNLDKPTIKKRSAPRAEVLSSKTSNSKRGVKQSPVMACLMPPRAIILTMPKRVAVFRGSNREVIKFRQYITRSQALVSFKELKSFLFHVKSSKNIKTIDSL